MRFPAPAWADLLNPRQTWLRNSTAGLFLHWGMRTNPGYTSCSAWESAITGGGWSANYWVQEAQKLHVQYLVLASFHSRLGYGRPWPSRIPDSCSTRRDFLGETIAAAKAKGLKVILYMTDDPQWFWEGLRDRPADPKNPSPDDLNQPNWFDSAAYSKFKGHQVNMLTRPGFGEFSYDNFFEVMRNAVVRLSAGGLDPAAPADRGRLQTARVGRVWYDGSDSRVDYKLTLGRMITNVGSSIKALEAETAQVNGLFLANQAAFNDFANGYLTPIWSSLSGVEGGGYMYGGLQPGAWNDGAYGVTTISKTNPNLHYIHAIDRPSGDLLRLRDNGYRVVRVSDLRTGVPFTFSQAGGFLTISGVTNWDPYDTVFKVETAGRVGILRGVTSADAPSLVDGTNLTWWDNHGVLPATITLDLGAAKAVTYLGVNQREWSVSYARSATGDSARIRDYTVETSLDGITWTPAVAATMKSARGVQFIDLGAASARYVRLTVNSTWPAASLVSPILEKCTWFGDQTTYISP